ncbi:DNA-binding transcriptional regulator NtrC [Dyadobacter sp. CECT 9623]|uniref:DNA-binding transcriptional regulator NtrC n=1 Tax=Dyadobacter linearis TaxID=2823330 RepID=A0ABM8UIT6_9BACT|nr:response regulator [Dyadobacter sp. CECT 9623]CAG5067429.1 DNA-binding transcriptional regulator NtrC [Dyadobacter sp. CECT 9623]
MKSFDNMKPIYIVDDSADQRLLLGYFIKRINPEYQITFFDGGRALLDSLAIAAETGTALPQIIVLDLQMPGMTGYQVLKMIKSPDQNEKHKEIPVVILSSHMDQDLINQCLDAGALAFLHKPVDFEQLRKLLSGADILATRSAR